MAKDTQDGTVDEDLNRAMREGKEFEQKVLESM